METDGVGCRADNSSVNCISRAFLEAGGSRRGKHEEQEEEGIGLRFSEQKD